MSLRDKLGPAVPEVSALVLMVMEKEINIIRNELNLPNRTTGEILETVRQEVPHIEDYIGAIK